MVRPIFRVLILALLATTVAFAQNRRTVTPADYDRAVKMLAPALNGLVVGGTVDPGIPTTPFNFSRRS